MTPHFLLDLDPASRWVVITLGTVTILYSVMRGFRRKKDPLAKAPSYASLSQQRAVERQMQNVLVELSEMARQITAQLDTRAAKLEALIQDADQRIASLKSRQPNPAASAPNIDLPPESMPLSDPRHSQIYTLADQGRSTKEIAQQLDRPSGEIELILALRR